ncbi:MAG: hypothetical protein ACRDND_32365 [Streptosporangiaceae bacterium]
MDCPTFFSIMLSATFLTGPAGALWIIIMRVFQGVGGAFLFANSTAILTEPSPRTSGAWRWASTASPR